MEKAQDYLVIPVIRPLRFIDGQMAFLDSDNEDCRSRRAPQALESSANNHEEHKHTRLSIHNTEHPMSFSNSDQRPCTPQKTAPEYPTAGQCQRSTQTAINASVQPCSAISGESARLCEGRRVSRRLRHRTRHRKSPHQTGPSRRPFLIPVE